MKRQFLAGSLFFLLTFTAFAQTSEIDSTSNIVLDEALVSAQKPEISRSARSVTIISVKEIENRSIQSIQDLLNYISNVDVVQRGGHGVQADISLRGGSFDQTAILLNGVNLSNPQTGHYSFDIPINLNDIERIEIIHGPSSLQYGASAFSGGINIITKQNPDHKFYAALEGGMHNLFGGEAGVNLRQKNNTTQLSVGYKQSAGYRYNTDYNIFNVLLQNRFKIKEGGHLDIQAGVNDKKYGANAFYTAAYPDQYDITRTYLVSARGEIGNSVKFIPTIYWHRHYDTFQLIREGVTRPAWYTDHNYHVSEVFGTAFSLRFQSDLGVTTLNTELRNESIYSNVLGHVLDTPKGKYTKFDNRTNVSYSLDHFYNYKQFSLTFGVLANYNTSLNAPFEYYPTINADFKLTKYSNLYGSWNQASRLPTFTDLYYTTDTHIGNTDLKPEKSESYELGFRYHGEKIYFSTSAFYMIGKNIIDWVKPDPDDKWESRNITSIYKKGIEAEVKLDLGLFLDVLNNKGSVKLGYTYMLQNKDSEEYISNYSLNYLRNKISAAFDYQIVNNLFLSCNFRWQERMGGYLQYVDNSPTVYVNYAPFALLDAKLSYKYLNLTFDISANNIFNIEYYDFGNIPQPGIWIKTGITYKI